MTINNPKDPRQVTPGDDFARRPVDAPPQADPELAEGPASGSRIAIYAFAVMALLGVVFYGLNNSASTNSASNPPPAATADNGETKSNSPAARAVTPNRDAGMTTGAAPAQTVQPPQSSPQGTQIDRGSTQTPKQ
jgi:hypothetical protein